MGEKVLCKGYCKSVGEDSNIWHRELETTYIEIFSSSIFYLGYWIPLFPEMIKSLLLFIAALCVWICVIKDSAKRKSVRRSLMDFWNSAWQGPHFYSRRFQSICGERGWGGRKTWHCQDWIDSPSSWHTHLFDPLYPETPDWLTIFLVWDISCNFPCMI